MTSVAYCRWLAVVTLSTWCGAVHGEAANSPVGQPAYPLRIQTPSEAASITGQGIAVQSASRKIIYPAQKVTVGPNHTRGIWSLVPYPQPTDLQAVRAVDPSAHIFHFKDKDGRLTLYEGQRPVLTYIHQPHLPDGVPEDRRRSSYVHPLYGLDGEVLTDDFPKDHYHHRGLFWTWPQVKIGQAQYDHWTIRGMYSRFEKWLVQESGPVCAILGIQTVWTVEGRPVLRESIWYQVFRAGETFRFIDATGTFAAMDEPVTIGGRAKSGYGGFNLRAAPRTHTVLTTDKGTLDKDDSLTPFAWADLSARFDGRAKPSGVAIFPHPDNPDLPTGWTLRHYGFLGVAWPGLESYTIVPGKPLTLRYRLTIHRNAASTVDLPRAYHLFTNADMSGKTRPRP